MYTPQNDLGSDLYGNLDVIGPHNLLGSGSSSRCNFVGVVMDLEEVCHYEGRL